MYIEDIVKNFSKYHKYTIGSRLRELSFQITVMIMQINNAEKDNRLAKAVDLRDKVEELKISISIAKELKAFSSIKSFEHIAELAVNLSRQSEGWLKSIKQKNNADANRENFHE